VDAYGKVMRYLDEKKISPGAMWECYLNDPDSAALGSCARSFVGP
jgi:hypothetical protein